MKNIKRFFIIIIVLLLLLGCGAVLFFLFGRNGDDNSPEKSLLISDENAQEWDGEQELPQEGNNSEIAVPGFGSLFLYADQKEQKVNLYNPDVNSCLMKITLFADEQKIYESGYVQPGHGYYDIELIEPLESGEYKGIILYECFLEDGTSLNNAEIEFNLKVGEK